MEGHFEYKDERGGLMKDETNGVVDGGRNERKRGWNEGDDPTNADEHYVSDEIEEEKPTPKKDLRIAIGSRRRWTHMWAKER